MASKKALLSGSKQSNDTLKNKVLAGKVYVHPIAIDLIDINPYQPRKHFDEEALDRLGENIRVHGLQQPISVIKGQGGRYTLVAGERRLRASKRAKLTTIMCLVQEYDDATLAEKALWENILREDLSHFEIYLAVTHIQNVRQIESIKELAQYLQMSYNHLRSILAFGKLTKESLNFYHESDFKPALQVMERLTTVNTPSNQLHYLQSICSQKLSKELAIQFIKTKEEKTASPAKVPKEISTFGKITRSKNRVSVKININAIKDDKKEAVERVLSELESLLYNA